MTVQFSRQAIASLSASFPTPTSSLVRRLVRARNDPGKERIRMRLLDLTDAQLRSGLGLTLEDIAVLRRWYATKPVSRASEIQTTNSMTGDIPLIQRDRIVAAL